jgi:hypothetical protein
VADGEAAEPAAEPAVADGEAAEPAVAEGDASAPLQETAPAELAGEQAQAASQGASGEQAT